MLLFLRSHFYSHHNYIKSIFLQWLYKYEKLYCTILYILLDKVSSHSLLLSYCFKTGMNWATCSWKKKITINDFLKMQTVFIKMQISSLLENVSKTQYQYAMLNVVICNNFRHHIDWKSTFLSNKLFKCIKIYFFFLKVQFGSII